MGGMVFGTKDLKYWVCGPSGSDTSVNLKQVQLRQGFMHSQHVDDTYLEPKAGPTWGHVEPGDWWQDVFALTVASYVVPWSVDEKRTLM